MKIKILVSIFVFIAALNGYAKADNASDPHKELFLRYVAANTSYNNAISDKSMRLFSLTFPECQAVATLKRLTPRVIITPRYDGLGLDDINRPYTFENVNPTQGQWVDRSLITGCGQTAQFNYIASAYDIDKIPTLYPILNGQTRIDIIDQPQAEKAVHDKIQSSTSCQKRPTVLGSIFLGYNDGTQGGMAETNKNRGWYERWIVRACDTPYAINLATVPDGSQRYRYIIQITNQAVTE